LTHLLFFIWRWVKNTYVCIIHLIGNYIMALVGVSSLSPIIRDLLYIY
jgi:hypothetical protein